MNKIFLLSVLFLAPVILCAQNTAINNSGTAPHPSAMLDVSSPNKGVLIPRMSTSSVAAITNPAKGLLVFDSTQNQLLVNNGTATAPVWQTAAGGWNLTGNGGTNPAVNFLGTTDTMPLIFRVKNLRSGIIDSTLQNTAMGFRTLDSLIEGNGDLTAFGYKALLANTTGSQNIAIGSSALRSNKGGTSNTAVGVLTMFQNLEGIQNSSLGFRALQSNTAGSHNIAAGAFALLNNTIGQSNVAIGINALKSGQVRSNLVAIGDSALLFNAGNNSNPLESSGHVAVGSKALQNNSSGFNNTAIGFRSLFNNAVGNNNTALGYKADVQSFDLVNATAIGANAVATQSNSIQLGSPGVTVVNTAGNLVVKSNKGIIRSNDATQQKKLITTIGITATIAGGSTISTPFTWPETFGAAPDAYVGNILSGSGFNELVMNISGVTATGGTLNVTNFKTGPITSNFIVKVIAIGAE